MMRVLIRQATVADPRSPWHGQCVDILTHQGHILDIAPTLEATADCEVVHAGMFAAPGFTDVFSGTGDPGMEHKETLETGAAAAKAGGYARIMMVPNTQPEIHSKSQVTYVVQKSRHLPAQVLPIGAITRHCQGKELAEMHDMHQSGAVAFSDGWQPLQNSQVMLKALQYVKAMGVVLIQVPDEQSLSRHGLMNEGVVSTRLGLPGKPALAETLLLQRDIELLAYTQSKLHITGISTAASVELIRQAKAKGLQLTCSVTPYHLWYCDEDLADYNTYLKVNPPLRTTADKAALRAAVLDGTIDCIASHHHPHEWDSKICEFEYAKYGMEGLETCVAAAVTALGLNATQVAQLFAIKPAEIFGLPLPVLEKNAQLPISLFALGQHWTPATSDLKSASANNAFLGKMMNAVIIDVI